MEALAFVLTLFLLAVSLVLGGAVAIALADDPDEPNLLLKGVLYAFLGNVLITVGPAPIPITQIVGLGLAWEAKRNRKSRLAAWGIGLTLRLIPFLLFL